MRILVTGGAGYIGSITTRVLLDAGHECVVLDTLERGHRGAVDARAEFVQGSVGDEDVLDDGPARLRRGHAPRRLHRGRRVGRRSPEVLPQPTPSSPRRMLKRMQAHGVDAIVFSSTAAVYGEPESVPDHRRRPHAAR